jgi:hypothetical protein
MDALENYILGVFPLRRGIMKNKVLPAIGILFGLAALFSACSDDNSSAPSATIATPDISSSSNVEAVPSSSEVPASSADAIPLSSESLPQSSEFQESSSSSVFLPPLSSSWLDGGNYNPAACCVDTIYIENGTERVHKLAEGVCPPPSIMTVTCVQPVRVNLDSIKAAEVNQDVPSITFEECLSIPDVAKMGPDSSKTAKLIKASNGPAKIEFLKRELCEVDADLSYELLGDTLSVNLAEIRSTKECQCYSSRFRIVVPDTLQDFTYFKFEDSVYGLQ